MKSQSENLTKEYNRMADERNSMEVNCFCFFVFVFLFFLIKFNGNYEKLEDLAALAASFCLDLGLIRNNNGINR